MGPQDIDLPSVVVSQDALRQAVIGAYAALEVEKRNGITEAHVIEFVQIMYNEAFSENPSEQSKALSELIDQILGDWMKIQRLVLYWQSYKGPENVFDFRGPESTNNSGMIIGRNAQGKSALFEAIQFVLYGQLAVVDRDSKNIPKRCKPLAAESVEAAPLMNQDAWDAGEREFSVSLDAVISNTGYTFVRKMTATTENPNDDDFKPQFFILSQPTKTKIKNPEKFVEDILPQSITKFFMIDVSC